MNDYRDYYGSTFISSGLYCMHYGVKGMKWHNISRVEERDKNKSRYEWKKAKKEYEKLKNDPTLRSRHDFDEVSDAEKTMNSLKETYEKSKQKLKEAKKENKDYKRNARKEYRDAWYKRRDGGMSKKEFKESKRKYRKTRRGKWTF